MAERTCDTADCEATGQAWVETAHPHTANAISAVRWTTVAASPDGECYCWAHLRIYLLSLVDTFQDWQENKVADRLRIGGIV